ncbi:MAG TPA: TetR/AcrR family transcriptional regulator, partial [Actinomycetota bacterium]|nr:TetR/AcrR family transcriptional regulator [Actinomycetota bacterium]
MSELQQTPEPPWLQRPPRSRRTPLSRDSIVDAALAVLDRDGYDGFSMRAVGDELGTGPASLYWHVKNKDELLNLVIDRVAGELEVPDPDPERWQDQVKDLARQMRAMYHRHPGVARITLGRIPVGPHIMEVNERILAILRAAGLPDRTTAYVVDLFSLYIGAYAFEESMGLASPTGEDLPPDQIVGMIKGYFASLPADRFPNTLAL